VQEWILDDTSMSIDHADGNSPDKWVALSKALQGVFGANLFKIFVTCKRGPLHETVADVDSPTWSDILLMVQSHNLQSLSHSVLLACLSKQQRFQSFPDTWMDHFETS